MIESKQVFGEFVRVGQIDFLEACLNVFPLRRTQARCGKRQAEGIDIVAPRHTAEQGGFNRRRAASHKRVIDDISRLGQALDEEARQLGFKAGAIGDFMERTGLALLCRPELVDKCRNCNSSPSRRLISGFKAARGLAEFLEICHLGHKSAGGSWRKVVPGGR